MHGSPGWWMRAAPFRAAALGLVLIVFGATTEGFGLMVWFGAAAVVVALVGLLALRRSETRAPGPSA